MTKSTETLMRLNALRTSAGQKPVKAGSFSNLKMTKMVGDLEARLKPREVKKTKVTTSTDTFTVAELAKELGVPAKQARARCRHSDKLPPFMGKRHTFENRHRAAVAAVIQPKRD